MFQKIVLATEGSKYSIRATEYAIELAKKFGGSIDVAYVIDDDKMKADVIHKAEIIQLEKEGRKRIKIALDLLKDASVDYNVHILHGEAGPTLVRFSEDSESDCVVIGSRGLNNLQTFLLGSVSHKVAKRANCPVLIVK